MKFLANMKQKTLLTLLPIVFVLGFGIFAWIANRTVEQVKIGGEAYNNIMDDLGFESDVAPAPLFLVQAYSVVQQINNADTNELRAKRIGEYKEFIKARDNSNSKWSAQLKTPRGRDFKKLIDADPTGPALIALVEDEFMPLALKGDRAGMAELLRSKITPAYEAHEAAMNKIIDQISQGVDEEQKSVEQVAVHQAELELVVGLILLSIVVGISLLVRSMAIRQQQAQDQLAAEAEKLRVREREDALVLQAGVEEILKVVSAASAGDLTREITIEQEGAIGHMADGLRTFLGDLRRSIQSIAANAQTLSGASDDLSVVSQQMSANAVEASSQANTVSAASEQLSMNVQTVAAGTEEMSASIREIARNAAEAAKVAATAVTLASTANATIEKLADSSNEVGKVIKLITSVAQQTKTLALNATVEAARAGEAGKGFAVVANEVKELAKETAKATEDISQQIETIQNDTRGAVAAIGQISAIINQINDIQNTIASAVEEQTATTNEMSRNLTEGAKGTNEITRNISGVAKAAEETSLGAAKSLEAAQSLSRMAVELERLVGKYSAAA